MLTTFEEWTDDTLGPKWAREVGQLIWERSPAWITCAEMCRILGFRDKNHQAIRKAVHFLRHDLRAPIMSQGKPKGYNWARGPEDLTLTINHGQGRVNSIQEWVDDMESVQAEWRGDDTSPFTLEFSP